VSGSGQGAHSFSCPFHSWVYDIDTGSVTGRPRSCDGFAGATDIAALPPVPVAEAHGLVVVRPRGDAPVDVDQWLGGLDVDLGGYDYPALTPFHRAAQSWQCNWKLLLDTFLESYHVFALHRESIGGLYLTIASPFDAFGPHNRIIVPQATILENAERPEEDRDLWHHAVVQYFLAPNVIISNLYGYVMIWRFVPEAAGVTVVEQTLYTYQPVVTDADRAANHDRFAKAHAVTATEDFPASEAIHRNLATGLLDHTTAGRNEPGIAHFHRTLDRLMTSSPPREAALTLVSARPAAG
jgi:phenylpropionate dioxygenase-like ring-hydroxylating dioxygenase large terminal subunit